MTALPTELHELPLQEKLDLLWSDIKSSPGGYEPPSWHGTVLKERLEEYRSGTVQALDFDQLVREWRETHPDQSETFQRRGNLKL